MVSRPAGTDCASFARRLCKTPASLDHVARKIDECSPGSYDDVMADARRAYTATTWRGRRHTGHKGVVKTCAGGGSWAGRMHTLELVLELLQSRICLRVGRARSGRDGRLRVGSDCGTRPCGTGRRRCSLGVCGCTSVRHARDWLSATSTYSTLGHGPCSYCAACASGTSCRTTDPSAH